MQTHYIQYGYQPTLRLGDPVTSINQVFDSWPWRNRKLIVIGGGGLLALGLFGLIAAALK